MNKRIEELARKAHLDWCIQNDFDQKNIQEFAELIIKECMLICGAIQGAGEMYNKWEFASGAAQCRAIIKRDFEIKE